MELKVATVRLKHVHRFRDRHGVTRHYLRMPGCKGVALPGAPGSPEFMAAYQRAIASAEKPAAGSGKTIPGSLDALAVSLYAADLFQSLAPATQATYRRLIESIRAEHGTKPVRLLHQAGVQKLMAEKQGKPAAANHRLRVLRLLMRHAIAIKLRTDDPTAGVERHRQATKGFQPWSEEAIAAYRAKHPTGTVARRALELLLNVGQRRGDTVRMGRQHIQGGAIHLRQEKTKQPISVPILPELAAELAHVPAGHLTFLALDDGRTRSSRGFYNTFMDWCREAGVPAGMSPHGLRKACGRRLAEAGCSAHEIMAILGHKTLAQAQQYTADADRKRLAESAMAKVQQIRQG
jgi:integrase